MTTTTLGDFELTLLTDGGYYLDGGAMFGVVPKVLWSKKFPPDEMNRLRIAMNTLVVRTGDKTIVIETGAGNKLPEKSVKIYGNEAQLMNQLEAAKVDPEKVDIVINTHLHFDHCGWNTIRKSDGRIAATFPRAKYYMQKGELAHAHEQHERDRVSYLTDNYDPLVENGQAVILDGDAEIAPGISVRMFPGHTAYHMAVVLESQGKRACYIGDLIPTTYHLHPSWVMGYDLDPIASIDNRHRFYNRAIPEHWLVIFTHDPHHPWAYVARDAEGKYSAETLLA